ncbi:type VII secretion protein EccCa [Couchioplanes azureus]|uniref:type VII secretion protein EccCa n=1 Tax=Couchioplanes caeruleus TaxID=56438 RepID=UPI0016704888|nr:type VII secretion protein EccCa [Couchioplanes caeruleus]GGQ71343.1 type VII secretion protein EccC [Couchioplanes caeruleus subsp. azureus]
MTMRVVHRPARTVRPLLPPEARQVAAPPTLPEGHSGGNAAQALLPVAGVLSSLTMMVMFRGTGMIAIGAVLLIVTVGAVLVMLLTQRGRAGRTRRQQRERYLDYLEELREELLGAERETAAAARLLHPPPQALLDVVRDPARLWERRRTDRDFLTLRAGSGTMPVAPLQIEDDGSPLTPTDPFMLAEARALVRRFGSAPGMPLVVPLDRVGNVSVVGARDDVLAVLRVLLVQAAALHAPEDLRIGLACPPARIDAWQWLKWLPHLRDADLRDGPVAARRIAADPAALAALVSADLQEHAGYAAELARGGTAAAATALLPRLLLVHDTFGEIARDLAVPDQAVTAAALGVTVVHLVADRLQEPGDVAIRITVTGDDLLVEDLRPEVVAVARARRDRYDAAAAEGLARLLAPLRLSRESVQDPAAGGSADFLALLGLAGPRELSLAACWAPRSDRDLLRVPIGVDQHGEPVLLDLKESAQLGMGPHGLCVGATGSGKSELLRSLVLALLVTHPPDVLAMVLVDYKGGATFAPFADAPHVAGVITNLQDDVSLVERVHTSLAGEVQRRQQALKDAGNVANIADYAALRARRPELPALPYLLVIIDEFGELLTAKPEFIELFLSIGRIGRSIGVHLLLSSQRIEGGKLRGLETYLSYRLGLRTFSEGESRTVLETPDAYHLPPLPGFGYLKVDTTVYQRFKASYVSGPYRAPDEEKEAVEDPRPLPYPAYNGIGGRTGEPAQPAMPVRTGAPALLDLMTGHLRGAADAVPRIWLPPLPAALTLDQLGGVEVSAGRGLHLRERPGPMRVPLGLLDDPARQWQGRWTLDLTVAGGHLAVIGGPQSGRTTLLRTLVTSLALTHTPREVAVYAVDLTGSALGALSRLPHVGGVAARTDTERVRRTLEEVRAMLDQREQVFREHGIDSVEQLRRLHAAGRLPELPTADVVLVIDGYGHLSGEFEAYEPLVTALLHRGGGYGLHVVASMLRWYDVRIAVQSTIGTQIELRLGDPTDSAVDRRLAELIRPGQPGRALTGGRLFGQVALPRIDARTDTHDLGDAIAQIARAARAAWSGPVAPPVRVLPARLDAAELPAPAEPAAIALGVDEATTAPVGLDLFGRDANLLVLGDGECGKTNLLALIARRLVARHTDDEIVFAVVDPRRGLDGVVPDSHLGGYAHNAVLAARLAGAVARQLEERQNGTAEGDPATWPHIVLLVDDYDVLTAAAQPLGALQPYLAAGDDLRFHVVLARRVAGASRGLYEPFVQTLREIGATGLVMTGDRGEGKLLGDVYARPLPPGRGQWIRRGEPVRLIQTAWQEKP